MRYAAERQALVACSRRLVDDGLCVGTAGNLSVRVGDEVVVTPSGVDPHQLTPADMVVVDRAGAVLDGARAATSELAMHLAVYDALADAGAVVHAHSPFATALGCVAEQLPAVHYAIVDLGGPVRVAPYATFGTTELADRVRAALVGRWAALLQNHGAVTTGPDLARAYARAVLLEWLCGVYSRAVALGPPRLLDEDELDAAAAQFARLRYGEPG